MAEGQACWALLHGGDRGPERPPELVGAEVGPSPSPAPGARPRMEPHPPAWRSEVIRLHVPVHQLQPPLDPGASVGDPESGTAARVWTPCGLEGGPAL